MDGGGKRRFFTPELDPLDTVFPVTGGTSKTLDTILESWCAKEVGPLRRERPSTLRVSGPYLRAQEGQEVQYLECTPIGDDKAMAAKEVLFSIDPSAEAFVRAVEKSEDEYTMGGQA